MPFAPRDNVRYASAALVICAGIGLYLGLTRANAAPGGTTDMSAAFGEHVPSAKAIAPPPAPTLDETAVRRIAREEAQTLVAKAAPAPAPHRAAAVDSDSEAPARPRVTTPSDAGLVYARPPKVDPIVPPAPPATPQLDQY